MRSYLLDRFRTDGDTLRQRVTALKHAAPQAGPDAIMSQRMAAACDDVVAMIEAIPEGDDPEAVASALTALIPLLEQRATAAVSAPPVRAVYVGAATRIREVVDAERRHAQRAADDDPNGESDAVDADDDDLDEDDRL